MSIKKRHLFLFVCSFCLLGDVQGTDSLSLEQKLKLKLIEEHWKDKEYSLAKRQIEEYFSLFSTSIASSHLHCMLGDLLFEEKKYAEALAHYEKIAEEPLLKKAVEHRLFCYLMLKQFKELRDTINLPSSQPLSLTSRRIFAEGLFLEALEVKDLSHKNNLLILSEKHYRELLGTSLETSVLSPLAEIAKWNKNYPAAAEFYLKLSGKSEEKKSTYEYQAAKMFSFFDIPKAVQLLDNLRWSGSEIAFQAALKEIEILATAKNYQGIINIVDEEMVTAETSVNGAVLTYYQAKALLCDGRVEEAKIALQRALTHKLLPSDIKKKALLALVLCGKQLKDFSLADLAVTEMKTHFQKDPDLCTALLVHLGLSMEEGHLPKAKEDLSQLRLLDENGKHKERYLIDEGIIEAKMGNYEKAGDLFENFLTQEPHNALAKESCKQLLKCCSRLMEEPCEKAVNESLFHKISLVRKHADFLAPEEKETAVFLFAKSLFDNGKPAKALEELSQSQFSSPDLDQLSHLLAAKIHEQSGSNSSFIVHHLEKALEHEKRFSQKAALHVKIFNATLGSDENKAAENLFQTFSLEPYRIQDTNIAWLAHYYFRKAYDHSLAINPGENTQNLIFAGRALRLFYTALGWDGKAVFASEKNRQNTLGQPLLCCARLLIHLQREAEARTLLEAFLQNNHSMEASTKLLLAEVKIVLAKILAKQKETPAALALLDTLIQNYPVANSKIGQKALLERCHILKEELFPFQEKKNDPVLQSVMSSLKLLEITRLDAFEPIGIEAALDGIEIKLAMLSPEEQKESTKPLFEALKERYTQVVDRLQQSSQSNHHKTAELLSWYLIFIDDQIKEFTRSEKGDTHGFGDTLTQLKPLEQRSDADGEFLRQRLFRWHSNSKTDL